MTGEDIFLYAFIGAGKEEIIPVLIEKLNTKGNKTMAEAYLNGGQPQFANTAKEWAEKHGYVIKSCPVPIQYRGSFVKKPNPYKGQHGRGFAAPVSRNSLFQNNNIDKRQTMS
ncbi:MAG: hypothetical protein HZA13_02265 [Nitrospirae bacterium]|nr:hypothetical protein [Nitrospirota bacterium]